jgi:hypothetical protein
MQQLVCKQCIGTPAQGAWCMLAVDVGLAWHEIALCRRYIMSMVDAGGWCGVGSACKGLVPAPWGAPTLCVVRKLGWGKLCPSKRNQCMPALAEKAIALACAVLAAASQQMLT